MHETTTSQHTDEPPAERRSGIERRQFLRERSLNRRLSDSVEYYRLQSDVLIDAIRRCGFITAAERTRETRNKLLLCMIEKRSISSDFFNHFKSFYDLVFENLSDGYNRTVDGCKSYMTSVFRQKQFVEAYIGDFVESILNRIRKLERLFQSYSSHYVTSS